MGKGIMEKFLNFIGFESEDEEEAVEEELEPVKADEDTPAEIDDEEEPRDLLWAKKRKGSVVQLPSQKAVKVIVLEPSSFDEVPGIAEHLRNRRPVLVNLDAADKDVARRIIDFLSGTTYAISGTTQKVGNGVFLFAPANVDVSAVPSMTLDGDDEALPWTK
ncbi:MAG: cell division protein SepF [Chloroflexota bacterium]